MKLYLLILVTIPLISDAQCGLIDGIFGAVKDTTNAIKEDITGVVRYGKNAVFGENKPTNKDEVTERSVKQLGIVDTVSLKIHGIATNIREHVRNAISIVDGDENGNSFLQRMYNKVKGHATKVKGYFFGGNINEIHNQTDYYNQHRNVSVLSDKLRQYVFRNSTTSSHGLRKTLQSLRDVVESIRSNMTKHNKEPNTDGEGLLDIRMAQEVDDNNYFNNNLANGVHAAYAKVRDEATRAGNNARNSFDDFKRGSNQFLEDQRNSIQNNYNNIRENGNKYRNDLSASVN